MGSFMSPWLAGWCRGWEHVPILYCTVIDCNERSLHNSLVYRAEHDCDNRHGCRRQYILIMCEGHKASSRGIKVAGGLLTQAVQAGEEAGTVFQPTWHDLQCGTAQHSTGGKQ